MRTITVSSARSNIFNLIDFINKSNEPVLITGKRNNAVLISEEDWRSIDETLYLLNIPGMRESIIEGMNTPIEECSEEPGW